MLRVARAAAHDGRGIAIEVGELQEQEETEESRHGGQNDEPLQAAHSSRRRSDQPGSARDGTLAERHAARPESAREERAEEDEAGNEIDALDQLQHGIARPGQDGIGAGQEEGEHRDDGQRHGRAAHGGAMPRTRERAQQLDASPGGLEEGKSARDHRGARDEGQVEPSRGGIACHEHGEGEQGQGAQGDDGVESGVGGEGGARPERAGQCERAGQRRRHAARPEPGGEPEACCAEA